MINEIVSDNTYKPRATYIFALCCVMVTLATLVFPNLDAYFGAKDEGNIPLIVRTTVPFQHGFSEMTRLVHLGIMLLLMLFISRPLEKVIGTFRFVLFFGISWVSYVIIHRLLEMQGHGFHTILWAQSVILWYVLGEAKYIKTRSSFQENYRLLRAIIGAMWILAPVMMVFIPLHFKNSASISLFESAWNGNVFHLLGLLLGVLGTALFRPVIRKRMMSFGRKKKFYKESLDNLAFYGCFVIPVWLAIIVFFGRA